MKTLLFPKNLKLLIPGCGLLGFVLRLLMVTIGTDDKGLIKAGHPAWIALLVLTAAAALVLLAAVRSLQAPGPYRSSFPASAFGAAGGTLAAVSAVISAFRYFQTGPVITGRPTLLSTAAFYLCGAVMFLAAVSFAVIAICRLAERRVPFLLHVVICIFFALQMLNLYQTWSFDPQIQDYCFELFACIALTMTAYHLAAFDLDKGSHRKLWFWGLAAAYLCCLCLTSGLFFPACGLWAWANLTSLRRPRQRKQPEAENNEVN